MDHFRIDPRRRGDEGASRRRGVTALPVVVLVLALVGGCSGAASESSRTTTSPTVTERPYSDKVDLSTLPAATTFGDIPAAPKDPKPHAETEGVVLRIKKDTAVYDEPRGNAFAKLPDTQFRSPTWVPIVAERGDWARVLLPSRPNRSTGWVRVGNPDVRKARSPYVVDVDVDGRELVLRKDGREIESWSVGVGAPDTRTPKGRTFILASIRETVSDFSPIILPLGTHSEAYTTYGGGPGTVALHGWPDRSVFGTASSDGCIRVPDDALRRLRSLPLGTMVQLH